MKETKMNIRDEIDEMFSEIDKDASINKEELWNNKPGQQSFGVTSKYWEQGIVKPHSLAWTHYRCNADEDKPARFQRFIKTIQLISSGEYSIREVAEETGYAILTVHRIFKKVLVKRMQEGLGDILCPCGKPRLAHKGWCSFRFEKSEKRQALLKRMQEDRFIKRV